MNIELLQEVFSQLSKETKEQIFIEYAYKKYINQSSNVGWLSDRLRDIITKKTLFLKNIHDPNTIKSLEEKVLLKIIEDWEEFFAEKVKFFKES